MAKHVSRAFAPVMTERREIRIPIVEADAFVDAKTVPLVTDQIDRHAHRKVAAHREIERYQHALDGVGERRDRSDHAVDDRLAVLGFAGLEVWRVAARLDEIAFGIDAKEPWRLAADLSAQDEGGIEADVVAFQVLAIAALDVA